MQIWLKRLSTHPVIINSYSFLPKWFDQAEDNTVNKSIDNKHKYKYKNAYNAD